jgi:tetratricopeptide (TPR) repeat protein
LLAHLEAGNGWSKIYLDPAAVVFARSDLVQPGLARVEALPAGETPSAVHARLLEALDRRPFNGPPIREIALGHYFSVSGDPAGAEFFLGRALKRLPRSAALLHDYGLALERQGRRAEARAAYERALEADPGMAAAEGALGALALDDGDLGTAERLLDAAYRGGERSALVLSARARLFERQGKARDAADAWGEAILTAPARRPVLLGAARFHVRRDEPGPALALYGRLLDSEPGDPVAAVEKAQVLEGLGRLAESLEVLRAAGERVVARLGALPSESAPPGAPADDAGDLEAERRSRVDDLRLLEMAARLEERAGNKDKARQWRRAMLETGGGSGS